MEIFAALRIRGKIEETGKWMNKEDYVDINISKEEAERIQAFLKRCLDK